MFIAVLVNVSWNKSAKRLRFCLLKVGISLMVQNQNVDKKNVTKIDHYHGEENESHVA